MTKWKILKPSRAAAADSPSDRRRWLNPIAYALVLVTPFLGFIEHYDYGALAPEVLAILLALAGVGLVLGLVLLLAGPRPCALGLFLLLVLFTDIQFGWNSIAERPAALLSLAILPLAWALRAHLTEIATAAFAVTLVSVLVLPGATAALDATGPAVPVQSRADLPPVLHLVLDEHTSIEGISTGVEGGAALRARLRAFYADRGFRLYVKAYSRYAETAASLAHTLNFSDPAVAADGALLVRDGLGFRLTQNNYFERLRRAGYRLQVHQTGYLDLCGALEPAQVDCWTTEINDLRAVRDSRLPVEQKAQAIAKLYLERSAIYKGLRLIYGVVQIAAQHGGVALPIWPLEPFRVSPLPALAVLDEIETAVSQAAAGDFIFGHVLLPHYPYALTADCRVRPPQAWLSRDSVFLPGRLGLASPEAFTRLLHRRYYQQIACLYRRLDRILEAVARSPLADDFIVVLHGDHGAKIQTPLPVLDNLAEFTRERFVANYATLFAVRAPGVTPGASEERRPVQDLFRVFVDSGFAGLAPRGAASEHAFVYVSGSDDPLSYGARKVPIVGFEAGEVVTRP